MHSFCIFIHCANCTKISRKFCLFCLLTKPGVSWYNWRPAEGPNPAPRTLYAIFSIDVWFWLYPLATPETSTGRDRPDGAAFHLDLPYAIFSIDVWFGPGDPAIPENPHYMRRLDKWKKLCYNIKKRLFYLPTIKLSSRGKPSEISSKSIGSTKTIS